MIRVYDDVGNVIETHEHAGEFYRRPSLERAYAFARVRFAVASLLLLFRALPSRIGKYGRFYAHKRCSA